MCHIILTLHVHYWTFMPKDREGRWWSYWNYRVFFFFFLRRNHSISTYVRVSPPDNFKVTAGQFSAVFIGQKKYIFDGNFGLSISSRVSGNKTSKTLFLTRPLGIFSHVSKTGILRLRCFPEPNQMLFVPNLNQSVVAREISNGT